MAKFAETLSARSERLLHRLRFLCPQEKRTGRRKASAGCVLFGFPPDAYFFFADGL